MFTALLTIIGLCIFESVSSIDNAVINAEILATTGARAKRWFLTWGLFFGVFLIRGLLPWFIVWAMTPLGPIESLLASFSSDPSVTGAIEAAAPPLLTGGGVFLLFLFLHWLFLEEKRIGIAHERFFQRHGSWFFACASVLLLGIVWASHTLPWQMAFSAVAGSTAFFITHGFKQQAEEAEKRLLHGEGNSDVAKLLYLEAIDATFSIDGVLGAFAFTRNVPLILLGSGLGAIVVRQLTMSSIPYIRKLVFLKNGAMYSIAFLGAVMLAEGLGVHVPSWVTPVVTMLLVGVAAWASRKALKQVLAPEEIPR